MRTARPTRKTELVAAAILIVGLGSVAIYATVQLVTPDRNASPAVAVEAPPATSLAMAISGPGDVSVVSQVYEPGQASGWHSHSGIHAVAVLSGSLTIYDGRCARQTFGPGSPYIGGQELHIAINESAEPAVLTVTYINPAGPHSSTTKGSAPAGCAVGQ